MRSPRLSTSAVSLVVLAVVYLSVAGWLGRHQAFWSPDSGARFATIRNWLDHGAFTPLRDPVALQDPEGTVHALRGYLATTNRGPAVIYPIAFTAASGALFRFFGWAGLLILPLAAGLVTAWAMGRCATRLNLPGARFAPLIVGLATPLLLHSTVFWDHSIQIMVVALALLAVLRGLEQDGRWEFAAAGAILGAGVWIHEVLLVAVPAFCLAAIWNRTGGWRQAVWLGAGAAAPLLLWMAANWALFGMPLGPHLEGPNQLTHPYHVAETLDLQRLAYRTCLQLVGEPGDGLPVTLFCAACLALGFAAWLSGRERWLPAFAIAAGVAALPLLTSVFWATGLLAATPLLLPALFPPVRSEAPAEPDSDSGNRAIGWLRAAAVVFVVLVLVNPKTPGMDWGSRYLLTMLPAYLLVAWHALARHIRDAPSFRPALAAAAVLIAVSIYSQCRGLAAVDADMARSRKLFDIVERLPAQTTVAADWWLEPELCHRDGASLRLFVERGRKEDLERVLRRLEVTEFTLFGSEAALGTEAGVRELVPVSYEKLAGTTEAGLRFIHFRAREALINGNQLVEHTPR
jgi:hypothetical protein